MSGRNRRIIRLVLAGIAAAAGGAAWLWLLRPAVMHTGERDHPAVRRGSEAPVPLQVVPEEGEESLQALLEEASEAAVVGALENLEAAAKASRPTLDPAARLAAEYAKREKVVRELAPYSQVQALLKDAVRDAEGTIAPHDVPGLVEYALKLEAGFWEKGDFDDISSFERIYEARAVLELCLEADPRSEPALRAMIEVLDAGWPWFLSQERRAAYGRPNADEDDRALLRRDREGFLAIHAPLWTLWEEHVATREVADISDLAVAADAFFRGPPPELYARFEQELRSQNPGISEQELSDAKGAFRRGKMKDIVDWALAACRQKGGEWDLYAGQFGAHDERLHHEGYRAMIEVLYDPPFSDSSRYAGRGITFLGPAERREKLVTAQQMLDYIKKKFAPR